MAIPEYTPEELATEQWRPVLGYEGLYDVSSLGRVKRIGYRGGLLSSNSSSNSYRRAMLCAKSKGINCRLRLVHTLVAESFLGPCPIGMEVNHKDSDKSNPRLTNLEYVTHRENIKHASRRGLMSRLGPCPARQGDNCTRAKLTSSDVLNIRRAILLGITGAVIAKEYRVSEMTVSSIKRGVAWKHLTELRDEASALGSWKTCRRPTK